MKGVVVFFRRLFFLRRLSTDQSDNRNYRAPTDETGNDNTTQRRQVVEDSIALARMEGLPPYTLHPAPYTLQPTPHTLHPTPYTLHPTPYTLHPTPCTLHPTPCTLHPTPHTLHPTPYTLHPSPYTLHPTPYTLHPTPYNPHPTAPKWMYLRGLRHSSPP